MNRNIAALLLILNIIFPTYLSANLKKLTQSEIDFINTKQDKLVMKV